MPSRTWGDAPNSNTGDPLRDRLQALIDASTRSNPPVFVGREDEIAKVLRTAANQPSEGPQSATILVQGAPGAGKTALLSEIERRLKKEGGAGVVHCRSVKSAGPDRVYGALAALLAGGPSPVSPQRSVAWKAKVGTGFLSMERTKTSDLSGRSFSCAADIADSVGAGGWRPMRRAVVLVDEVQQVGKGTDAANLFMDLHTQSGLPALMVLAGLPNSEAELSDAGLSRLENKIHLGGLTQDETVKCATLTLEYLLDLGVRGETSEVNRWGSALAEASDCWPRHLQTYLQAAYQALLDAPDHPDLAVADLDAALQQGGVMRKRYYSARMATAKTHPRIIAALHSRMSAPGAAPLAEYSARKVIFDAVESLDPPEQDEWASTYPKEGSKLCLNSLLRSGVVSMDADGFCVSPIPSLSQYILQSQPGSRGRTVSR